ncbi:hypothetical protein [Lutibacter sp.]
MKYRIITLMVILSLGLQAKSQELLIETGKSNTFFDYKNSQGNTLNNLQATNQNYVSVGYRTRAFVDRLHVLLGVNYNTYGAIGSDDILGNFMEWEVSYVGPYVGLDLNIFSIKKMKFYLKSTFSLEYIVQGTQTLNNTVYNLVNADDFDKTNLFFRGGVVIDYPISKTTNLFVQYMGGKSKQLRDAVTNPDQEKLKLVSRSIGIGLQINLKSN